MMLDIQKHIYKEYRIQEHYLLVPDDRTALGKKPRLNTTAARVERAVESHLTGLWK